MAYPKHMTNWDSGRILQDLPFTDLIALTTLDRPLGHDWFKGTTLAPIAKALDHTDS